MNKVVQPLLSETTIMKGKDLMRITGCGKNEAYRFINDIKEEYKIQKVMYHHVKKYFSLT